MAQRALTPSKAAYCSECGAETPPDAASCARCGEPFEGSMQAVLCPICNSINPAAAVECLNCNAKFPEPGFNEVDRKSTRLNSSHVKISYAVFCLKKKRCKRSCNVPLCNIFSSPELIV